MRRPSADLRVAESGRFDLAAYLATSGPGRAIVHLKLRQTLYSQGDICTSIFYLQKGRVSLTVTSEKGKEATVALFSPGDFVGQEAAAASVGRYSATASAVTACTVLKIDRMDMLRVMREQTTFSDLFIAFLVSRAMRLQEDLLDQLFRSSEKRLAHVLLMLAQYGKSDGPEPLLPKISQQTLAEMTGTTRPRVSLFLKRFRELGYIDYNGRIKVNKSLFSVLLND